MQPEQFILMLSNTHRRLVGLTMTKGAEYAGGGDQLANFKRLAVQLELEPETVLLVYLTKHMDSIHTFIRSLEQRRIPQMSESIDSRIDDAILYLALLKGLLYDRDQNRPGIGIRDPSDDFDEEGKFISTRFSVGGGICARPVDSEPCQIDLAGGEMVFMPDRRIPDPVQKDEPSYGGTA